MLKICSNLGWDLMHAVLIQINFSTISKISQILAVVISWQTGNTDQFLASVELYAKSSN